MANPSSAGGLLAATLVAASIAIGGPALAQEQQRPDLTVAVDALYRTLEPIDGNSTPGNRVHAAFYNWIVGRNYLEDPEGRELVPELAISWEQTSPTVWEIQLREGVLFHNGEEMTAEDVAFSISEERVWGENALVPAGQRFTDGFVRVEATGPYTVEVETATPEPNLMARFTTQLGIVVPRDYYLEVGPEQFGQRLIGTGPYRVTSFDSSDHLLVEAFDEYWGGPPPAASIRFQVVPEFSARLAGMVSGQFDMMVNVPVDQLEVVERYDQLELVVRSVGNYVMLAYNTLELPEYGHNPVADRNLRYAMTSAIDREALVEALWGDATFAPAPFNFPEFGPFYDPDVKPKYPYDPEAARRYLEQSDYNGEEIVINVTRGAFPNFDLAVEYLAEQWTNLGLNIRLNIVDSWALALQHPFGLLNMSMDSEFDGTPTRSIWGFWGPASARASREADRSWEPPAEFIELGEQYLVETDLERRIELFRRMVEIWEDEMPALMLWRNVASWVHQDWIDWTPTSSIRMYFDSNYLKIDYEAMRR